MNLSFPSRLLSQKTTTNLCFETFPARRTPWWHCLNQISVEPKPWRWVETSWEKRDEVLGTLARSQRSQAAQLLGGGNWLVKPPRCQWFIGRALQGAQRFGAVELGKHQDLRRHRHAAQQQQVGLPESPQHEGLWGFSSSTESHAVERFPKLRGLQDHHHVSAGGSAEGCPGKAGIQRAATSGLAWDRRYYMDAPSRSSLTFSSLATYGLASNFFGKM